MTVGVDRLGDLDLVVQDALHQLAVVLHDRALAGGEAVALGPAQADADAERADLGVGVDAARIAGDVQAGDAERAAGAGDLHDRVQHGGRAFDAGVLAVAVGFEADAVDGAIDFRHLADDLLDLRRRVGAFSSGRSFRSQSSSPA